MPLLNDEWVEEFHSVSFKFLSRRIRIEILDNVPYLYQKEVFSLVKDFEYFVDEMYDLPESKRPKFDNKNGEYDLMLDFQCARRFRYVRWKGKTINFDKWLCLVYTYLEKEWLNK